MPSTSPVPRYPLGEYAYQGLWLGAVLLPVLLAMVRLITASADMTFALFAMVGIPAIAAGQAMAGVLAWSYRKRQWRHWMGPAGAKLSFAYYGAWLLLILALPESRPDEVYPSLLMRLFGQGFAEWLSSVLFWVVPGLFMALLAAIMIEGERAVKRWRPSVGGQQFSQ